MRRFFRPILPGLAGLAVVSAAVAPASAQVSTTRVIRAPAATTVVRGPSSTTVVRAPAATTVVRGATVSGPAYASRTTVVVDRSQPGWWRGQAGFVAYSGPRAGFAYAPGYGYYAVTYSPFGGVWVVGAPFPPSLHRYVVVTPAMYGLSPAPVGYGWYYAGNNFVMVRHSTGVVTRTVAGGW